MELKIDLRKLRGRSTDIVLNGEDGEVTLSIKPLPFNKYLELVDIYEKKIILPNGAVDEYATKQQQAKGTSKLVKETILYSYPMMTAQEVDENVDMMSTANFKILVEEILKINGLEAEKRSPN